LAVLDEVDHRRPEERREAARQAGDAEVDLLAEVDVSQRGDDDGDDGKPAGDPAGV
jgi:hypothetical protein